MIAILAFLIAALPVVGQTAGGAAPAAAETPAPGLEPAPGELLANRSFELDSVTNGVPDGWSYARFDTDSAIGLDDQAARSGRRAVRIEGAPKGRAGVSRGFGPAETDSAAVYLLSAWIKVDGTSHHPLRTSARITSVDAAGNVLNSDYRLGPVGPCDWTHCDWLVTLPPATRRFNIVLFHHGEGTAWWDDVSLRRARPLRALAPVADATVPGRRPTFRWQEAAGDAVLEVVPGDSFAGDRMQRHQVSGGTFELPVALPDAAMHLWRVVVTAADGSLAVTVARDASDDSPQPPRFFAGTWPERMAGLQQRLAPYRELLPRLQAFAERHRMWDAFSLLAKAVELGGRLAAEEPADPRQAQAEVDALLDELAYTAPWWEAIFLNDAAFFAGLDLELPGLEAVRVAAAAEDWPAARAALLAYYRARKQPSYYARYQNLPTRDPAVSANAAADTLLEHKFAIHSYKEPVFDVGPDFNWHVHPIVDVEWPTKIHRHFHWSTIASAYWQTGNEKYAAELVQQLLDWAKDNPMEAWQPARARFAWSTLNATIRIYSSWINSWYQIKDSQSWNADAQVVFMASLREHGRFLMRHAARYGNWVVAEARGLVEMGVMFPEFREAREWRDEGYRRLRHELEEQVLSDGVHVERTPGYHGMTLGCFMEPVRLGLLNGVDVIGRERFVEKLEQMHEFYLYGVKPDGRTEQFGDSSMSPVAGSLRRGWEMFRREDMLWVLTGGSEGRPPVHRSYAFDGAGFYFSRSAWNDASALWSLLNWRTGFVGHCHEDMGHLSITAYGANLLIDTGIYAYARPLRLPFYETVGHNTVMVNRTTQKRRGALNGHWVSTAQFDFFHGEHDNSEPAIHARTMVFRQPDEAGPGYWVVLDRLSGTGSHRLDQRWHPTERLAARADGATVTYAGKPDAGPQPSIVVANLAQPGLATAVVEGAVSYQWYKKVPVEVAQFTLEGPLPAVFATILYPTPAGESPAQVSLEALPLPDGAPEGATVLRAVIQDRGRSFEDLWILNPSGQGTLAVAGVETDSRLALVRREGGQRSWFLADGTRLSQADTVLFQAGGAVAGAGAVLRPGTAALWCTEAREVRFHAPGEATLNGAPASVDGRDGAALRLQAVAAVVVPPPPKASGGPRFEIEPPPPPLEATSRPELLPSTAALAPAAVVIEAEAYSGQGGGSVQITETKVGAQGKSFLHWDSEGHWLEWRVTLPAATRARLLVRACTAESRVLRRLTVNGVTPPAAAAMEFAGTGGYSNQQDNWRTFAVADAQGAPLALELPAGETVLRLENVDGRSMNLDWIALEPL